VNGVLKNFKMAYPEDKKRMKVFIEKYEIGFDLALILSQKKSLRKIFVINLIGD
jgi:hypothetical protein